METQIEISEYIDLKKVLELGQEYVRDYFIQQKKYISAVRHERATNTCFEKADLLDWDPKRVIKSVYLSDKKGKYYGFVAPELGIRGSPLRFNDSLLKKIFSEDKVLRKSMMGLKSSVSPVFMTHGTYTPFIPDYFFDGDGFTGSLEKIFIYDFPDSKQKVDISIGGLDNEAHKISLWLDSNDIYKCLNWKFGDKIEKITF